MGGGLWEELIFLGGDKNFWEKKEKKLVFFYNFFLSFIVIGTLKSAKLQQQKNKTKIEIRPHYEKSKKIDDFCLFI